MGDLYLLCGQPGSGKSTFAKNYIKTSPNTVWVPRDVIRFALLSDSDKYFAKEEVTYEKFVKIICYYLEQGYDVLADQTNLTPGSRQKLLNAINAQNGEYNHAYAIWIKTSLETSLARNEKRTGREYVPPEAIKNMFSRMKPPMLNEGFDEVKIVNGE